MKAVPLAALVALSFFRPAGLLAQASPAPAATAVPAPSVPKDTPILMRPRVGLLNPSLWL